MAGRSLESLHGASIAQEVSERGFGGGAVQFQMFF